MPIKSFDIHLYLLGVGRQVLSHSKTSYDLKAKFCKNDPESLPMLIFWPPTHNLTIFPLVKKLWLPFSDDSFSFNMGYFPLPNSQSPASQTRLQTLIILPPFIIVLVYPMQPKLYTTTLLFLLILTLANTQTCQLLNVYANNDTIANATAQQFLIESEGADDVLLCTCPDDSAVVDLACVCSDSGKIIVGGTCVCGSGYQLIDNACVSCLYPCTQCDAGGVCLACESSYVLQDGSCDSVSYGVYGQYRTTIDNYVSNQGFIAECPAGCSSCTEAGCTACIDTHYLKNSVCYQCRTMQANCLACTSANCTSCRPKYYLDSTKKCVACAANCLTCTKVVCNTCIEGYYAFGNGCVPCSKKGCASCVADQCSSCLEGFAMVIDECIQCIDGCNYCSSANITRCLGCINNYYMNENETCSPCPTECLTCLSVDECTSCVEGYFLNATLCTPVCNYACDLCAPFFPERCVYCYAGYIQYGNTCGPDIACNTTNGTCLVCPRGYTLHNNQCIECSVGNCTHCVINSDSSQSCLQCNMTYGLVNGTCKSCPEGCFLCNNDLQCQQCQDGYYLEKYEGQSTGKCLQCNYERGCETCVTTADNCLTCNNQYWNLTDNKCVSQRRVVISLRLNIQPSGFYSRVNRFKDALLYMADMGWTQNERHLITISSIVAGSTIINCTMGMLNPETDDFQAIAKKLKSSLAPNKYIDGIQLLESEIYTQGEPPEQPPKNRARLAGMIVGLCLLGIGVLLLTIMIVRGCCRNRSSQYQQNATSAQFDPNNIQIGESKQGIY